jgi:hypothetical protein
VDVRRPRALRMDAVRPARDTQRVKRDGLRGRRTCSSDEPKSG